MLSPNAQALAGPKTAVALNADPSGKLCLLHRVPFQPSATANGPALPWTSPKTQALLSELAPTRSPAIGSPPGSRLAGTRTWCHLPAAQRSTRMGACPGAGAKSSPVSQASVALTASTPSSCWTPVDAPNRRAIRQPGGAACAPSATCAPAATATTTLAPRLSAASQPAAFL